MFQRKSFLQKVMFAILLGGSTFSSCFASQQPPHNQVLNHIPVKQNGVIKEMTLEAAMAYFKVPAISFAVVDHNKIIWVQAVGYKNAEQQVLVNTDTLFQAGSLSKSVGAVAALKMVDKGQLSLDASVNPLLKGWQIPVPNIFKNDPVTLRELLSMSAGLGVGGYYGYQPGEALPTLIETLSGTGPAKGQEVTMLYKPGSRYEYSGGGYEVAELLMDSQSDKAFPEIVQNLVLTPLAMTHSNYQQPLDSHNQENAAEGTGSDGQTFPYKWRVTPEYAAAGLWSTPDDLAKFILSVMKAYQGETDQVISPSIAKEALAQQKNTQYGLGFVIEGKGKKLHFMKLGQNAGYQGWLVGYPVVGEGAVVMTNSDNGEELAQDLIYAIAKAYHWPTNGKLKDAWMIH